MVGLAEVPVRLTVGDFLDWESGDGLRYELVDGEPRAMAVAWTMHGFLKSELGCLIGNHLHEHRSDCLTLANPCIVPHLLAAHNVRIPDLAVGCFKLVPGQTIMPDPMLVIEILSPNKQSQVWSNVWAYTSIPAVQEILVLHSTRISAPDGTWTEEPAAIGDATVTLSSIGFELNLADLYARTGLTA
jgi:Uma2 family endonuclease